MNLHLSTAQTTTSGAPFQHDFFMKIENSASGSPPGSSEHGVRSGKGSLFLSQPPPSHPQSRRAPVRPPIQCSTNPSLPLCLTPNYALPQFVSPIPPSPLYSSGYSQGNLQGTAQGHPQGHIFGGCAGAHYPYSAFSFLPNMRTPLGPPMGSPLLASPWTQAMIDPLKSRNFNPNAPGPSPHTLAVQSIDELGPKTPHTVPSLSPSAWPLVPPLWLPQSLPQPARYGSHLCALAQNGKNEPLEETAPLSPGSAGSTSNAKPPVAPIGSCAPNSAHSTTSNTSGVPDLVSSDPSSDFSVASSGESTNNSSIGTIPPSAHVAQSPWSLILAHQHFIQLQNVANSPGSQQPLPNSPMNLDSSGYYGYLQQFLPSSEEPQSIWSPNGFLPSPTSQSSPSSTFPETKPGLSAPQAESGVNILSNAQTTESIVLEAAPKTILRRGRKSSVKEISESDIFKSETAGRKDSHDDFMDNFDNSLEYSEDAGKKTKGRKKKLSVIRVSKEKLLRKPRKDRYWLDQQANLVMDLEKHGFSAVLSDSGSFSCSLCGKNFETKLLCVRHAVEHLDYKPFKCTACLMEFTRCDTLQRHLKGRCLGSVQPIRGEESREKPRETKFIPPVVQPSH